MAQEDRRRRLRAAGWWLVRLVETALGMWVASVLVVGFTLSPWPGIVVAATAYQALLPLTGRPLTVLNRVERMLAEHAFDFWPDGLYTAMSWTWWAFRLAVLGTLRVVLLWLVVMVTGAIGVSSRLDGFWPTIAAAVALFAGAGSVRFLRLVTTALLTRSRRAQLSWAAAELPLTAVALAAGVLLLPGVELPADLGVQLLTVGVLARAITAVRLEFRIPFLVVASTLAVTALKLWLVVLLGEWMTAPLRIDGLLPLAALTVLITALAWPAVRSRRRRSRQLEQQAMDALTQHQMVVDSMTWGPHH